MQNTQKPSRSSNNRALSLLMAGLPLAFIAGLFVGFQIWGRPNIQTDQANDEVTQRYDIPIYDDDPVLGSEDAPVTIVEFSDYQCPYCQRYHSETFQQIMDVYGDQVRYVYKDLPLTSIHPEAVPAAMAAHCASDQGVFWAYHDLLFSNELGLSDNAYMTYAESLDLDINTFADCMASGSYESIVMKDTNILLNLNAPISTPTFFVNGQYIAGAQPFTVFAQLIEAELDAAN